METVSFRVGIDTFIYYNEPIPRNNDICKEQNYSEINNLKKYNIDEKK